MTEQEYAELMKSRAALKAEMDSGAVEDLSDDPGEGVGYDALREKSVAQGAPEKKPDQTSGKVSAAGDATLGAGMASGNPYVAAAGLALKTGGMVDDSVRQSEQAKIDAYNKKIMAQRSAIRNMFA